MAETEEFERAIEFLHEACQKKTKDERIRSDPKKIKLIIDKLGKASTYIVHLRRDMIHEIRKLKGWRVKLSEEKKETRNELSEWILYLENKEREIGNWISLFNNLLPEAEKAEKIPELTKKDLIEKVKRGEITPEEAEKMGLPHQEAERLKKEKEEEKKEVPKKVPSGIANLHPEFRRCIDGIHKYMEDLHDRTGKWNKDAAMRNLHRASQAYLNVYKNVKPIALNKESFYEFIVALSSGRRMIFVNWFHWLPKSLDDILNAKTKLENEKGKIEDKNLSKVADDILKELLGSETLRLFKTLREVYRSMIREAENLKMRK